MTKLPSYAGLLWEWGATPFQASKYLAQRKLHIFLARCWRPWLDAASRFYLLNDRMPSFFMLFCLLQNDFEDNELWIQHASEYRSAKWLPCQMRLFKFHESWTAAASMFYLELSMTQLPWSFSLPLPADFYLVSARVKPPNQTRVDNGLEMHILALKLSALLQNNLVCFDCFGLFWSVFVGYSCMDIPWFL